MKRFFSIFLCFLIMSFCPMLSACDNSNDNFEPTANPEYFLAVGYHKITFDRYTKIIYDNKNFDKVEIDDNTIMLPHNAKFKIEFNLENNTDFVLNSSNYVNLKESKILSGFSDSNKVYEVNTNNLILKNDINIFATFNNTKPVGVAIYGKMDTPENIEDKPLFSGTLDKIPDSDSLLYIYSTTGSYESFINFEENIISNATYKISVPTTNNSFSIDVTFEIFVGTTAVYGYLILKDDDNNFYFINKDFDTDFENQCLTFDNLSKNNLNASNFSISLCYDLSTSAEYYI